MGITEKECPKTRGRRCEFWPKDEDAPISNPQPLHPSLLTKDELLKRPSYHERRNSTTWTVFHSLFYNGLLSVDITPTRFVDRSMLISLGIIGPIQSMLHHLQIRSLPTEPCALYPDLVRQFLATVEVVYDGTQALNIYLFYFSSGKRYEIPMKDFCNLYGFRTSYQKCKFNQNPIAQLAPFWRHIAYGNRPGNVMEYSRIRNPALRMISLILEHTFYASDDPNRECGDLLYTIFISLLGLVPDAHTNLGFKVSSAWTPPNLGVIFAEFLAKKKFKALGPKRIEQTESVGSLLTPIFRYHNIDLGSAYEDSRIMYLDRAYLDQINVIRQGVYRFITSEGQVAYCHLPQPTWACTTTWESVGFKLPKDVQCHSNGKGVRRCLSARPNCGENGRAEEENGGKKQKTDSEKEQ